MTHPAQAEIGTMPATEGPVMKVMLMSFPRIGALLAVNMLFSLMWGFAAIGKVRQGMPSWFSSKFGQTILARFPGLTLTFWLLTGAELLALLLGAIALVRFEFIGRCRPTFLTATLTWSLLVFVGLAFGQWLTGDFNGASQIFIYFGITLFALHYVKLDMTPRAPLIIEK